MLERLVFFKHVMSLKITKVVRSTLTSTNKEIDVIIVTQIIRRTKHLNSVIKAKENPYQKLQELKGLVLKTTLRN